MNQIRSKIDIHFPTLIAISVIAFILTNICYQLLGQVFAIWIVNAKLLSFSSTLVTYQLIEPNIFQTKYIATSGLAMTFFISGISVIVLQMRSKRDNIKFFMWIFMSSTLLISMSSFLFAGITGMGDWNVVIADSPMYELWRLMYIFGGFSIYIIAVIMPMNRLNTYIGRDGLRHVRGFYFTFIPYLTGSAAVSLPGFLNSGSLEHALIMTAYFFGGLSVMAWMSQLFKTNIYPPERGGEILVISKSKPWIISAIVLFIIYTLVMGFGITIS